MATDWHPTPPPSGRVLRVGYGTDPFPAWVGYVIGEVGDSTFEAIAPKRLLHDIPVPYPSPGRDRASIPDHFDFWWRQLHYIFDLPDPMKLPPLPDPLRPDEMKIVERFTMMGRRLAGSSFLSSSPKMVFDQREGAPTSIDGGVSAVRPLGRVLRHPPPVSRLK
jgi:hypothetical protein